MTTTDVKPDDQPDDQPEAEPPRPDEAQPGAGPRAHSRWVRRLADVLLITGGLLLSYPFWSAGYAQVQQARLDSAYRDQSSAFTAIAGANVGAHEHGVPPRELVRRLAVLFGRQLKPGDPIGHLKIPRIGFNRLVQQGVGGRASLDPSADRDLLRGGPVHYGMTPLPGAGEPFAVSGHRTTYGAPFYKLDKLRKGDPIFLDTPYARFRYAVAKTTVVQPNDVSVLYDRGYGLVLTTCTPLYSASHRLIVWGRLVKSVPLGQKARSGSR
jgi:LPXTG-site transpeptidase (sortase) family protein